MGAPLGASAHANAQPRDDDDGEGHYDDQGRPVTPPHRGARIAVPRVPLHRGAEVDVLEPLSGAWLRGVVADTGENDNVFIHFCTWPNAHDAWLEVSSPRLAVRGTHVLWPNEDPAPLLRVGLWCDFRVSASQQWATGVVREVRQHGAQGVTHVLMAGAAPFTHAAGGGPLPQWVELSHESIRGCEESRQPLTFIPPSRRFWAQRERKRAFAHADPRVEHYLTALAAQHLAVVPMGGDGNCLFRSFADQVYGNQEAHSVCRAAAADYMSAEARWFRPFVADLQLEGGWDAYVRDMRRDGVWGDDPEVQALCELYDRPAEIWAYDAVLGARRLRTFNSSAGDAPDLRPPVRLSYYGGGHYDSVHGRDWAARLLTSRPGTCERAAISMAIARAAVADGAAAAAVGGLGAGAGAARSGAASPSAADDGVSALLALSRAQYEAAEAGNLELALMASLAPSAGAASGGASSSLFLIAAAGGLGAGAGAGAGGAAGADTSSVPLPITGIDPAVLHRAAAFEEQQMAEARSRSDAEQMAAAMRASLVDRAGAGGGGGAGGMADADDEEQLRQALALSTAGGGGDSDALMSAALDLTEEEQLYCLTTGITPSELRAQRTAMSLTAMGGAGGDGAVGAAGGGGGAGGMADADDEEQLRQALALSTAGGGGDSDALMSAALDLTEEEQLYCLTTGITPSELRAQRTRGGGGGGGTRFG